MYYTNLRIKISKASDKRTVWIPEWPTLVQQPSGHPEHCDVAGAVFPCMSSQWRLKGKIVQLDDTSMGMTDHCAGLVQLPNPKR
jgi:hypothetical protein